MDKIVVHECYDRKDAEKKKDEMDMAGPDWFCPLIKATCNKDCICFVEPRIDEPHTGSVIRVHPGYCNCYTLHGE